MEIKGRIRDIIYRNEINSYTIATFETDEEETTVVGYLPFIEKGDNLKRSGQNIKDDFATKFDDMKESNSRPFINQIEKVDCIYNKTKEIYFDKENIYLEMK